jgi:hypothetical protein
MLPLCNSLSRRLSHVNFSQVNLRGIVRSNTQFGSRRNIPGAFTYRQHTFLFPFLLDDAKSNGIERDRVSADHDSVLPPSVRTVSGTAIVHGTQKIAHDEPRLILDRRGKIQVSEIRITV